MKATDIPTAQAHANQVETLCLRQANARALARLLPTMPRLQHLDLSGCRLRTLPESIGQCARLETLILDRNQLQQLPVSLGQCRHLRRLSVQRNRLVSVPDTLANCFNLRRINLAFNCLQEWPSWAAQLPWLAELDISHNTCLSLPDWSAGYAPLQSLALKGMGMTNWPEHTGGLNRLERLDLSDNQLRKLPASWRLTPALKWLDVSGNPLQTLPPLPESLRYLAFRRCPLEADAILSALWPLPLLQEVKGLPSDGDKKLAFFLSACRKAGLAPQWRQPLFKAYAEQGVILEANICLRGLSLPLPSLRARLLEHLLAQHGRSAAALSPELGPVALWGQYSRPKSKLRADLQAGGWQVVGNLSQARGLIVGKAPYPAVPDMDASAKWFADEQAILEWLRAESPANQASMSEVQQQRLRQLLRSANEADTRLAMSLIAAKGLPPNLLTELLYAWLQAADDKLARQARQYLQWHTPAESRRLWQQPLRALWRAQDLPRLEQCLQGTMFDAEKLVALAKSTA